MEDNRLSREKLAKYAVQVSKIRKLLRQRALDISKGYTPDEATSYLQTTERLARKMHKGYFSRCNIKRANVCKESRRHIKTLSGHQTVEEKINMLHDVVVGKEKQEDVAKKYKQKTSYVAL